MERAKSAYLNGIDTMEEYANAKQKIQHNINAIKAEEQKYKDESDSEPSIDAKAFATKVRSVLNLIQGDYTPKVKNEALRSIISYIVYDKKNQNLKVFFTE